MNRLIAHRGLLQIFFALVLIIVIMFVSNYVVYNKSISGIYDEMAQNNRLAVRNTIRSIESSMAAVNSLIFTIHGLPDDGLRARDGQLDMSRVYTLQDNLASLVTGQSFIEDIIVFYDHSDLAITTKGTSDLSVLMGRKYVHSMYNGSYWKTFANSRHPFTAFPAADYRVRNESTGSSVTRRLMVAFDGNLMQLSEKNVMVLIDVDELLRQVDQQAMMPGTALIVLDAQRNILFSTEKDWDLVEVLNDVYFNPSREASLTRENDEYHFYQSESNGFIYIDKVPYQFRDIESVANASRSIMITAIICALIASVLLSVYLYRPVKAILKQLGGSGVKGNDFVKIHSGIVKVQAENESLRKQLDFVDTEIRRGVFLRMLDEYSHSREYELQMQKYYPDFFKGSHFIMAAVELMEENGTDGLPELPAEEIAALIQDGLLLELDHAVVFYAGRSQFLALADIANAADRKRVIECLEGIIARLEKHELNGYSLRGCVSRMYDSKIANCHASYQDILNGLTYRNVSPTSRVVDTQAIRYVSDIHFPLEKIEKLSNCVLSGKVNEGVRIIHEVVQDNADRGVSHRHLAHIARSMFYFLVKNIDATPAGVKELHRMELDFIDKVDRAADYREIRDALAAVAQHVGSKISQEQKSRLNPAFISQYIELHYMENLYLDHMAEVMGTSPKYFSNYFKKTFGVNYVEYLNKVRLSHAREFLRNSDMSIAEIGEKTGYLNSSTFTTTFKKYYGIAPNEYRKKVD